MLHIRGHAFVLSRQTSEYLNVAKSGTVVLIVEDDQYTRKEGALLITAEIQPDILLVDIGLPGSGDGLSLCEKLVTDVKHRKLQVIVITGSDSPEHIARAKDLGLSCYINKPFLPSKLASLVLRLESTFNGLLVIPRDEDSNTTTVGYDDLLN
ncbi:MAG: response regulator [Sulfuritalea sp.]|nr:response regulator [Sulfuritalea sp.]